MREEIKREGIMREGFEDSNLEDSNLEDNNLEDNNLEDNNLKYNHLKDKSDDNRKEKVRLSKNYLGRLLTAFMLVLVLPMIVSLTACGSSTSTGSDLTGSTGSVSSTATGSPNKSTTAAKSTTTAASSTLKFRNSTLKNEHYEKHGIEMGFKSADAYEAAAAAVVSNPSALHKTEQEDGDDVYYVESTNEFVIVSKDGYIRTYFLPSAGISYYNRQ